MITEAILRGMKVNPPLYCAPLAGISHCAFRRLVAEFGGCGAYFTEMLSAPQILHENMRRSPALRRCPGEERLIYQLMIRDTERLEMIIGRLAEIGPDGLDINLACHAPSIRQLDAGSRLFENFTMLANVLATVRRCWPGLLTVKIRLGSDTPGWEERFADRMRLFAESGVDAVILHPRFFEDRFRRRARHELLAWARGLTVLPLIANGDITGAATIRNNPARFEHAAGGFMVGRMAIAQPWVFAAWTGPIQVDHAGVWRRLYDYICEDFPPPKAIGRIKVFTEYYARNYHFGHSFYTAVQNAPTLEDVRERADAFFSQMPAIDPEPSLMGL